MNVKDIKIEIKKLTLTQRLSILQWLEGNTQSEQLDKSIIQINKGNARPLGKGKK